MENSESQIKNINVVKNNDINDDGRCVERNLVLASKLKYSKAIFVTCICVFHSFFEKRIGIQFRYR